MPSERLLPEHVAIIMDGNGRWAKSRRYPRFYGHVRGVARVKQIVTASRQIGIKALTLYAFSTENWKRPEQELNVLWALLKKYLRREIASMKKNGIRLRVIGELARLPGDARQELGRAIEELSCGKDMELTFALSYGARAEITHAVRAIAEACASGAMKSDQIQESTVEKYLSTSYLGEWSNVDLLIRTSGEKRLSNYLLWQCSYAEFDFPETLWPDYSVEEFKKSLENFKNRNRRFGGV
ncbi:MAG: di-trans,poly-cis-decaprenylcistransferase [Bdellovibrionales bacterium]|nr:di-trans,poly-cis-decaprenylcistransferase [Bdellovibrionales bacterium]